ncbi:MAG TPA: hypothetical protein VD970_15635 [Acetobacteraceae bacterium]|nr:hypothetical protein [Acetobacteraceae bacterium]
MAEHATARGLATDGDAARPAPELQDALRLAEARAARAEARIAEALGILRHAERLLRHLQRERDDAMGRAAAAISRAEAAEQQARDVVLADRTELDAAIIRASDSLAELDEAQNRALEAEWRAARAEARIQHLLRMLQQHAPSVVVDDSALTEPSAAQPPLPVRRAML